MRSGDRAVICTAAMRPVVSGGRRFWLWMALFSLPVLWGLYAYVYQLRNGLGVTGLSNQFFWGTYETNLVAFIGFSYGGALVSAILRLTGAHWRAPITRMAEAMALVTLLIGSAFALVHLGRPERAWQFLTNPQVASPLVWDFVAIMTYMLATVVFLYLPMIPDLAIGAEYLGEKGGWRGRLYRFLSGGWQGLHAQHRLLNTAMTAIAILIIPVAITVHSVLSWAFAVHHREGWHSSIFGPYFVMAALYSGVAMVILVVSAFRKAYGLERFIGVKQFRYLGFLLLVLGPLYLYFTFSDLLTESYVMSEGGQHFIEMLLLTNYATLFWTFVVLGILLPTLLVAWPLTQTVGRITLASALIVVTMWLKRFLIVVPTLAVPLVEEAAHLHDYTPSWVEIAITLAATAAIPLLLALFFRVFPILSVAEIEEAAAADPETRLQFAGD